MLNKPSALSQAEGEAQRSRSVWTTKKMHVTTDAENEPPMRQAYTFNYPVFLHCPQPFIRGCPLVFAHVNFILWIRYCYTIFVKSELELSCRIETDIPVVGGFNPGAYDKINTAVSKL